MDEDKRMAGRRGRTRRMYDLLEDALSVEEKHCYDRLLYSRHIDEDRRGQDRRSGKDRRQE